MKYFTDACIRPPNQADKPSKVCVCPREICPACLSMILDQIIVCMVFLPQCILRFVLKMLYDILHGVRDLIPTYNNYELYAKRQVFITELWSSLGYRSFVLNGRLIIWYWTGGIYICSIWCHKHQLLCCVVVRLQPMDNIWMIFNRRKLETILFQEIDAITAWK